MIPIPALLPLLKNKYLIAGVVGAAVIVGAWWWHTSKVNGAADDAYVRGLKDERVVWQTRLVEEVTAANAKYVELQEKYRALEKKSVADVAAVAVKLQKEKADVEKQRDKALSDARAGMAFRLRWAASCAPTPSSKAGGSELPRASTGAGGAGGTAVCELPERTREDLIRLASRADALTVERNLLLELAQKDREVCK